MITSSVEICNLALAKVKAGPIHSFSDENKRARQCQTFYEAARRYELEAFDWAFARKLEEVHQLAEDVSVYVPSGYYCFGFPNKCVKVRDAYPIGSNVWWRVQGQSIIADQDSLYVYFTYDETSVAFFAAGFVELLALNIAVQLAPSFDKDLSKSLQDQYVWKAAEVRAVDAQTGNEYKYPDNDADNDTFVDV